MRCLWEVAFRVLTAFEVERQAVQGVTDAKAATRVTTRAIIRASTVWKRLRLPTGMLSLRLKVQLTPLMHQVRRIQTGHRLQQVRRLHMWYLAEVRDLATRRGRRLQHPNAHNEILSETRIRSALSKAKVHHSATLLMTTHRRPADQ